MVELICNPDNQRSKEIIDLLNKNNINFKVTIVSEEKYPLPIIKYDGMTFIDCSINEFIENFKKYRETYK